MPVQEQQGGALNNLLTGVGIDQLYARSDVPGRLYFLSDALNSAIALTDSTGNVLQRYSYDPYGSYAMQYTGTGIGNTYTFTGREDDGTGVYYYRARYYSPVLQRFISEDPIGLEGGINSYAYADENPISEVDPLGFSGHAPGGAPSGHPSSPAGPSSCSYYSAQCQNSNGTDAYACSAQQCCESFGDNPFSNCTRSCLINYDKANCAALSGNDRNKCRFREHVVCYATCANVPDLLKKPWTIPACHGAMNGMGGPTGGY